MAIAHRLEAGLELVRRVPNRSCWPEYHLTRCHVAWVGATKFAVDFGRYSGRTWETQGIRRVYDIANVNEEFSVAHEHDCYVDNELNHCIDCGDVISRREKRCWRCDTTLRK